jgi:hypothetical protein
VLYSIIVPNYVFLCFILSYMLCVCSIFIMPKTFLILGDFPEFFHNINQQNGLCQFIDKTDRFIDEPTALSIEFK